VLQKSTCPIATKKKANTTTRARAPRAMVMDGVQTVPLRRFGRGPGLGVPSSGALKSASPCPTGISEAAEVDVSILLYRQMRAQLNQRACFARTQPKGSSSPFCPSRTITRPTPAQHVASWGANGTKVVPVGFPEGVQVSRYRSVGGAGDRKRFTSFP
jgi:hypothetical protein